MQFEVDPSQLRSEAQSLVTAAGITRQVSMVEPLASVSRAFPSGSTMGALGRVDAAWVVTLADLRRGIDTLAASVGVAAEAYDLLEATAAAALEAVA